MTYEIKKFYWHSNAQNCIDILNYEFQGVTEIHDDTYLNDESPSCSFEIEEVKYKLFFPSNYQGDYSHFILFNSADCTDDEYILHFVTISDVLAYFKNLNVI